MLPSRYSNDPNAAEPHSRASEGTVNWIGNLKIIIIIILISFKPPFSLSLFTKFQLAESCSIEALHIQYKDNEGELVTITDQEDLEYALDSNGVVWGETGGKVELWLKVLNE
jgi:hypothetical protein